MKRFRELHNEYLVTIIQIRLNTSQIQWISCLPSPSLFFSLPFLPAATTILHSLTCLYYFTFCVCILKTCILYCLQCFKTM